MDTIFWFALGAFVGWNFPQPGWAKFFQHWAQEKLRSVDKSEDKTK